MDDIVYQENSEKAVDNYDQFVSAEVCLPEERGRKMTDRFTKRVKDNEGNPIGIEQPALFADHYLYEVSFMNDRAEELTANAIVENMIFQVAS